MTSSTITWSTSVVEHLMQRKLFPKVKFKIPPTHRLYLNFTAGCLLLFFRLIHCSVFVAVNLHLLVFGTPQHKWRSAPNILQLHSFHELESWQYWLIDWTFACISEWLIEFNFDWFIGYHYWLIELAFTDWFELAFGDVCALALTQCSIHPIWVVTIDWLIVVGAALR